MAARRGCCEGEEAELDAAATRESRPVRGPGLTRLNKLKVREVKAALKFEGYPNLQTDKKLKCLRVHKFDKHLEKLAEEYAEEERKGKEKLGYPGDDY